MYKRQRLYILKARGIDHSSQVREFLLSDQGIQLRDVYVGPGGVLTGAARIAQEARETAETLGRRQNIERKQRELERRGKVVEAQIAVLRNEFELEQEELQRIVAQEKLYDETLVRSTQEISKARKADLPSVSESAGKTAKGGRKQ